MTFIDYLVSIIYGIVEGITEWLPISSTGHMILLDSFLKLNVSEEFYKLYLVVIQLGAIMAVVVIYWKEIWPFGIKDNKHPWKKMKVAEIFYFDKKGKGKFRFVPKEDITLVNEENKFSNETKYGLMRRFGTCYIEDDIYNFVCYDGTKY